uniref:BY PROTMAP: gi/472582471/gb/EMS20157.1/ dimethylaniline monooxygenase (N-oxide-forming) [Rhodosporidium toruloides NP11] gi/647402401/emb/CDR48655.1/ RHTO0S19e01728g1_1 [Rhodosporidium toruloides] n=1 Tax=Rhodotorula toruloides TaxID=5286 RepID=A0A0K3CQ10_RHOTO
MAPSADVHPPTSVIDTLKQTVSHVENVLPTSLKPVQHPSSTPAEIAQAFCDSIQAAFTARDADGIIRHFTNDGWWRDILTVDFDFNSIRKDEIKGHLSKYGIPEISSLKVVKPHDARVNDGAGWLEAFTTYETPEARGQGFLRLKESSPGAGDWKAFVFFTTLWEINGHEEFAGPRRPLGAEHGEHSSSDNWLDKRIKQQKFEDEDPTVLVLGAGQNGLNIAARLGALGIKTLVVEKNARVGDSWRHRYHTLCLHDPVWGDSFAYMEFPKTFPIYLPKDKIANWMEHYAEIMELNVWLKSTMERDPTYDPQTKKWTVKIKRDGEEDRVLNVSHIVLATGFSGEPRKPTFPIDEFKGIVHHSSAHPGARGKGWEGKKAVVIGCCNSGCIAADAYEHGLDTTIVQRSSTYVMSSKHGIPGLLGGVYEENGPPLENADIMLASLPIDLLAEFHTEATKQIALKDKPLLDDLQKAGFKLRDYPAGLFLRYFRHGGGYYIDVGCSRLIADGKIKVKQGVEVEKLTEDGVLFKDGVELKADIVVLALGYTSQRETVRRIVGDDVANRLGSVWGQDAQGEIPSVWRYSGVPRFWLQSGNLFQCRVFSKHLALQIQMIELGLREQQDDAVSYKHIHDPRF